MTTRDQPPITTDEEMAEWLRQCRESQKWVVWHDGLKPTDTVCVNPQFPLPDAPRPYCFPLHALPSLAHQLSHLRTTIEQQRQHAVETAVDDLLDQLGDDAIPMLRALIDQNTDQTPGT